MKTDESFRSIIDGQLRNMDSLKFMKMSLGTIVRVLGKHEKILQIKFIQTKKIGVEWQILTKKIGQSLGIF